MAAHRGTIESEGGAGSEASGLLGSATGRHWLVPDDGDRLDRRGHGAWMPLTTRRSWRPPAPDRDPCLPLGRDRKRGPRGNGRP